MFRKILLIVCLVVSFYIVVYADMTKALEETNAKFTYKGKPIHPFLVKEFSNWISDNRLPMITTVDVAAAFDTNRCFQSVIEKQDGWWFLEEEKMIGEFISYESFLYR